MQPEEFHQLKERTLEECEGEDTNKLVSELVGFLENDESMSSYSARALAIAYELDDRDL